MENKKIEWIDALRGFGMLLVIIGHIPTIPDWLFKFIYGFHMPLFFIIAGYLFNSDKWHYLGFKNFLKSRFRSFLIPFVLLSIIVFVLEISKILIFSNVIYWEEFFRYVVNYLKWILFQIDGDFCGSQIAGLWFIPTIFFSSIFLFLISDKKITKFLFCIVSFLLIKIQCHYAFTIIPWHLDTSLLGTVYMLFGYYIHKFNIIDNIKNGLLIICFSLISLICIYCNGPVDLKNRIYSNYFLMFVGACLLSFALFWVFNKFKINCAFLLQFGNYSLLVIAFNFVIYNIINKIFQIVGVDCHWLILFVIEILSFCIFIFAFNISINKYKKLSILTGNRV